MPRQQEPTPAHTEPQLDAASTQRLLMQRRELTGPDAQSQAHEGQSSAMVQAGAEEPPLVPPLPRPPPAGAALWSDVDRYEAFVTRHLIMVAWVDGAAKVVTCEGTWSPDDDGLLAAFSLLPEARAQAAAGMEQARSAAC